MFKNIIALLLITFGVFGTSFLDLLDKPLPKPEPQVSILEIDKPSEDTLALVKKYGDLIKDPNDRARIAIYNYEFATRVRAYDTSLQQLNDVYVLAGKTFFKDSLVGKYEGLADMLIQQIQNITTDEDHKLTQGEKDEISKQFMAIAWVLIQKVEK